MTFHTATTTRIREMVGTVSMEYRITLYYGDSGSFAGIDDVMVMVKSMEEVKVCPNSIETFS